MNKKVLYLIIISLCVVAIAGWSVAWNSTSSEAASPSVVIDHPEFAFDYPADAKLFNDHFMDNLESDSAVSIPDYPKDGKIYVEYFIQE